MAAIYRLESERLSALSLDDYREIAEAKRLAREWFAAHPRVCATIRPFRHLTQTGSASVYEPKEVLIRSLVLSLALVVGVVGVASAQEPAPRTPVSVSTVRRLLSRGFPLRNGTVAVHSKHIHPAMSIRLAVRLAVNQAVR